MYGTKQLAEAHVASLSEKAARDISKMSLAHLRGYVRTLYPHEGATFLDHLGSNIRDAAAKKVAAK